MKTEGKSCWLLLMLWLIIVFGVSHLGAHRTDISITEQKSFATNSMDEIVHPLREARRGSPLKTKNTSVNQIHNDIELDIEEIMIGWGCTQNKHEFFTDVFASGLNAVRFQTPIDNETWHYLELWDDDEWEYMVQADTWEAIEAIYPLGNYLFEFIHDQGTFSSTVEVDTNLPIISHIPEITSPFHGKSNLSVPNTTIFWEPVSEPDFGIIVLSVDDIITDGEQVHFLQDTTQTSFQVQNLAPNLVYEIFLIYANIQEGETAENIPFMAVRFSEDIVIAGTNTIEDRFDIINNVLIARGYNPEGKAQFIFEIECDEEIYPAGEESLFEKIELITPGDHWTTIFHRYYNEGTGSKYVWILEDIQMLESFTDGWYLMILHYSPTEAAVTPFWFGEPDSTDPLEIPEDPPIITSPFDGALVESPILFEWNPSAEPIVNTIIFEIYPHGGEYPLFLNASISNYGPMELYPGNYAVSVGFLNANFDLENSDSISYAVGKYHMSSNNFTVEEPFEEPTGSVTVTIVPPEAIDAGAMWRVTTGPNTVWQESGSTLELPSGDPYMNYMIEFRTISGWTEPDEIPFSLNENDNLFYNGVYQLRTSASHWSLLE